MTVTLLKNSLVTSISIILLMLALTTSLFAQGKNPLILVPGLTGSELKDKRTGEKVWIRAFKSRSDDIRLPISTDIPAMGDDLVAGDIIRSVSFGGFSLRDVYGGFVRSMTANGGYHEETWDTPSNDGYQDSIYVFPYDWRLDNVVNARLLIQKIDALKRKFNKPDLKFDLVAHSMGGIISRYAAMYGDAELPSGKSVPTWAGAKDIDKVVLLGTPNEGTPSSLGAFVDGFTIGGIRIDLPFVEDTSRFTVFTIPSTYELLPAPGTFRVYDEKLKPLKIDLYDPKVWTKYGWNPMDDSDFKNTFSQAEQKLAPEFFTTMLGRARRLHEALAATSGKNPGVSFYTVGSDCKPAIDAVVIFQDQRSNKWKTLFNPRGFIRSDGQRVSDDDLKKVMLANGDGVVTMRSEETTTQSDAAKVSSILNAAPGKYFCEVHNKLATDARIQDYIIKILSGSSTQTNKVAATN